MSAAAKSSSSVFKREFALFLVLFLIGVLVLPTAIYLLGSSMFGDYGGSGFSAFFAALHSDLRAGDLAVWFLVMSPYVGWQLLRLTYRGFKRLGRTQ